MIKNKQMVQSKQFKVALVISFENIVHTLILRGYMKLIELIVIEYVLLEGS